MSTVVHKFPKIEADEITSTTLVVNGMSMSGGGDFGVSAGGQFEFKIDDVNHMVLTDSDLQVDTINELTADNGVILEGVLVKDTTVTADTVTINVAPTLDAHATTKTYVDSIASGLVYKEPVLLATTGDVDLTAEQTIDGVLTSTDRVLVWQNSPATENGVYVTAAGGWARSTDMDAGAEFVSAAVFVQAGNANDGKQFVCTNAVAPTLGVTDIVFVQFAGQAESNNLEVDIIDEKTTDAGVKIETVLIKDGIMEIDTINDAAGADGVTIEGIKLKTSIVYTDNIEEATGTAGVTFTGSFVKADELRTDIINDKDSGLGVIIDGIKLKDNIVYTDNIEEATPTAGITFTGNHIETDEVRTDVIDNSTGSAGVTIETVLINDGVMEIDTINDAAGADGVTIEGIKLKTSIVYADDIEEATPSAGVTFTGNHIEADEVRTDVIDNSTGSAGVTIETVLINDGVMEIDTINDAAGAAGVTIEGVNLQAGVMKIDTIDEATGLAGVTIDGVKLKDNGILGATGVYGTDVGGGTIRAVYVSDTGVVGYDSSLRRKKMNIKGLDDVSWIHNLRPIAFNYKQTDANGRYTGFAVPQTRYGLIAEEAHVVHPNICHYTDMAHKKGLTGVSYDSMIIPLLVEVQKLRTKTEYLDRVVRDLKKGR